MLKFTEQDFNGFYNWIWQRHNKNIRFNLGIGKHPKYDNTYPLALFKKYLEGKTKEVNAENCVRLVKGEDNG